MKYRITLIVALAGLSPGVLAMDPFSILERAVERQINQQIERSVAEAFRSISTPSSERRQDDIQVTGARSSDVVIYTTPTCGYCKKALAHLRDRNVPFLEKDISADRQGRSEWQSLGGRGVPLTLIGNEKMHGFSDVNFDRALARLQPAQADTTAPAPANTATPNTPNTPTTGDTLIARIPRVKLLSDAHSRAATVGQLEKNEEVIFLGETRGRYLKVQSADTEGWADQALLAQPR